MSITRRAFLAAAAALPLGCRRDESERWDRAFLNPQPAFNTAPNAFLAKVVAGRKPGRALDLGMGQGRNALLLARDGWNVTGVDVSEVGVRLAREQAQKAGLRLDAIRGSADVFNYGTSRWDLVAVIYFDPRPYADRIRQALKPGGVIVVEGFHADAARNHPIGRGVVFDSNELPKVFHGFRVLQNEEIEGVADWGQQKLRLVRFAAEKP